MAQTNILAVDDPANLFATPEDAIKNRQSPLGGAEPAPEAGVRLSLMRYEGPPPLWAEKQTTASAEPDPPSETGPIKAVIRKCLFDVLSR